MLNEPTKAGCPEACHEQHGYTETDIKGTCLHSLYAGRKARAKAALAASAAASSGEPTVQVNPSHYLLGHAPLPGSAMHLKLVNPFASGVYQLRDAGRAHDANSCSA